MRNLLERIWVWITKPDVQPIELAALELIEKYENVIKPGVLENIERDNGYENQIHREDAMYLCGFNTREDRDLFNILKTI